MKSAVASEFSAAEPRWVTRDSPAYLRISIALFLAGFATFSLLYCVQPLLPAFAAEFGMGAAQSSLALSVSTGALAIAIVCAVGVSERAGRKSLMFASMAVASVCNLLVAVVPGWHAILLMRCLEGFTLGGVPAVAMAYLAEEIHPKGLGLSMGLYVGGTAFGGMIGRVGMSFLADFFSWRTAMITIGVIDLCVAFAFVAMLPASRNFVPRAGVSVAQHLRLWRGHLAHGRLPAVFAIGGLVMGIFVTVYNYAGFRLMAAPYHLNASQTGLIFSAYIFGIVASSGAGALADRLGRGPVLIGGIVVTALGLALTMCMPLLSVIAGISAITIGFFISHSVASGWVGQMASGAKGHASSLYLLAYYLGSSILGSCGGWFWQNGGWPHLIAFTSALLVVCLALAVYLVKQSASATVAH
ncbi:MFS transporter [Pararobbsia silviterrae]|uniref:MFS transporter n=1 Tax=Pararobbsia silviterrae TaxID=1792498 RepID=A0A494XMK3_9BURK|nr:MFS transporter [Pararobbsia silviterrae]RKP51917.1 MFS transporter [Pararobbsia silviterrae]